MIENEILETVKNILIAILGKNQLDQHEFVVLYNMVRRLLNLEEGPFKIPYIRKHSDPYTNQNIYDWQYNGSMDKPHQEFLKWLQTLINVKLVKSEGKD